MSEILNYTLLAIIVYLLFVLNENEGDKNGSADGSNSRPPKRKNRRKLRAKKENINEKEMDPS